MPGRLEGKVCVITGAASGIGAESARLFARRGRAGRRRRPQPRRRGRAGARRPTSPTRTRCASMYARVARGARPHRRALQQRRHQPDRRRLGARDRRSRPGSGSRTSTCAASSSAASTASRTCSTAGGGSVINTASFVAVMGAAVSQISYTASKGAVLAMSRELGVEFARRGVRVNALCPGPVNTPLLQELFAERPGEGGAAAGPPADGPLRRGARDRQRRALPRQRRVALRDRLDLPGRRRALGRLRDSRVAATSARAATQEAAAERAAELVPGARSARRSRLASASGSSPIADARPGRRR